MVSVLPTFSNMFGEFIKNCLTKSRDNCFWPHLLAYRTSYSTQHVLLQTQYKIKLNQTQSNSIKRKMKPNSIKEWKTNLDNNFGVGTVSMDLPKAFVFILH